MEVWHQINEEIELVNIKKFGKTTTMLFIKGNTIFLCEVKKTNDYFWVDYGSNENYIVVYSRGCMVNQIPLKVEAVYDIKNKKRIPVTKKNKAIFEYMCVSKKGIDVGVVLEFLNDNKLGIAEQEEIEDLTRYLTAGNEDITKEDIKAHILNAYPVLEKYINMTSPLSVKEYRKILDETGVEVCRLHIMPNPLKEEYLSEEGDNNAI